MAKYLNIINLLPDDQLRKLQLNKKKLIKNVTKLRSPFNEKIKSYKNQN